MYGDSKLKGFLAKDVFVDGRKFGLKVVFQVKGLFKGVLGKELVL